MWLDLPCPECKADKGKFCRWPQERPFPHDARLRVFRIALDLKNELEN